MSDRGNVVRLPQASTLERFTPTYIASLQGKEPEPIRFLVDDCIPRGAVTLLAGDSDLGKSYLAQQLLTAVALGKPWLGRDVERARTFGFFAEDSERVLHIRQQKISAHYEIEHADLELDAAWLSRDGGSATLLSFAKWEQTGIPSELWQRQLVPFVMDAGIQLVIIDTVARTFQGSENDRGQVTAFIEMMTRLAVAIDGAVVLTAHPPKVSGADSWYSGSGAWKASARSAMSLERPKHYDPYTQEPFDERVLWVRKGNYSGSRPKIPLRFVNGVFVAEDLPQRKAFLTTQERHDLDYRMLAALKRLTAQGSTVYAAPEIAGSLPKRAKGSTPEFRDWPLAWLADSVERLIATGRVVRVEVRNKVVLRTSDGPALAGEKEWNVI
jgi:RecA-family ATPase